MKKKKKEDNFGEKMKNKKKTCGESYSTFSCDLEYC